MNLEKMLVELIDATFDCGYYAATLEKMAAKLTDEEFREYARLSQEAIRRREALRARILAQ